MNRTLTVDGYHAAKHRDPSVQDWLESNGLRDANIYRAQFGEGVLHARCYKRNDDGNRYILTLDDGQRMVANELRDFPLVAPPPAVVYDHLEDLPLGRPT